MCYGKSSSINLSKGFFVKKKKNLFQIIHTSRSCSRRHSEFSLEREPML